MFKSDFIFKRPSKISMQKHEFWRRNFKKIDTYYQIKTAQYLKYFIYIYIIILYIHFIMKHEYLMQYP